MRDMRQILIIIAEGIPKEGVTLTAFENALLQFGITREITVIRYIKIMENNGLIKRDIVDGQTRWFKKTNEKTEKEIEKEVDNFLNKF